MNTRTKLYWMAAFTMLAVVLSASPLSAAIFTYDGVQYVSPQGFVGGQYGAYANGSGYSWASGASGYAGLGVSTRTSPSGNSHAGNTGYMTAWLSGITSAPHVTGSGHLWGDTTGGETFSSQMDFMSGSHDWSHDWGNPYDWGSFAITVAPSYGEVAGTPTTVTINAQIDGLLTLTGNASGSTSWSIVTDHGTVMAGSDSEGAFADSGFLQFVIPLGSTFTMNVEVLASIQGSGAGTGDLQIYDHFDQYNPTGPNSIPWISFSAEVGSPAQIPEPTTLAVWSLGSLLGLVAVRRRRRGT